MLLGGLVPAMLCSDSGRLHAGTTDVDAGRLGDRRRRRTCPSIGDRAPERRLPRRRRARLALGDRARGGYKAVIKFELLADLDDQQQGASVHFDNTEKLGAVNLRGTGYASRDFAPRSLTANDQGSKITAEVNVTGWLAFSRPKERRAYGRHKAKDYYDIAFVLLHHNEVFDEAGPLDPADVVVQRLGAPRTAFGHRGPAANFSDDHAQGVAAYVEQLLINNPEIDPKTAATDARLAVAAFTGTLLGAIAG